MSVVRKQRFWHSLDTVPMNRAILTRAATALGIKDEFKNRMWFLPQVVCKTEKGWWLTKDGGYSWRGVFGPENFRNGAEHWQWMDIPGFTIKNCEEMAERAK